MKRSNTIARRLEVVVGSIALAIVGAMFALAAVCQPAEVGWQLSRARGFFTNRPAL